MPLKTKKSLVIEEDFTVISDIKFKPERAAAIDEEDVSKEDEDFTAADLLGLKTVTSL